MKLTDDDAKRALAIAKYRRNRKIEYLCRAVLQFGDDSPDTTNAIVAFLGDHPRPSR